MRAEGWLFTIEDRIYDECDIEDEFEVWTEPPRLRETGEIRRRADGDPYTPAWDIADKAVVYHPESDRCWAVLRVSGPAEWDPQEELFFTQTRILAINPRGPRLAHLGIVSALQGGRHRLTRQQLRAALTQFGLLDSS